MKKIILLMFLLGCVDKVSSEEEKVPSKYKMKCVFAVDTGLVRCENGEAICYMTSRSAKAGFSCKFKEKK